MAVTAINKQLYSFSVSLEVNSQKEVEVEKEIEVEKEVEVEKKKKNKATGKFEKHLVT